MVGFYPSQTKEPVLGEEIASLFVYIARLFLAMIAVNDVSSPRVWSGLADIIGSSSKQQDQSM